MIALELFSDLTSIDGTVAMMAGISSHVVFLTLGSLFLLGLLADEIGRRTHLPRVSLLIACGILVGSSGLDLLPVEVQSWYELLAISALTMVAFLLGGSLTLDNLRSHGRAIVTISTAIVVVTIVVVAIGLSALGIDSVLALLLAAIASATAPASTQDAIRQSGADGGFVETLTGIVAIDDVWGLLAFSMLTAIAGSLNDTASMTFLVQATKEIGGAFALGVVIGVPAAYLTGRLSEGKPSQAEALGIVFLCAGLSIWLDVSFLIAGMTAGAVIVNTAKHHKSAFHEIENFEWPFMILFFILAGASLDLGSIAGIGLIGAAYIFLRTVSRILGGWIGATIAATPPSEKVWYGVALLPQAGVAVGMALVAAQQFPEISQTLLTVTIGTTVVFEILGPIATLVAIGRVEKQKQAASTLES